MKKGIAILLALGISMPVLGVNEISFANEVQAVQVQPVKNTRGTLETAWRNIQGAECALEANTLASLSKEEKYKALYKEKVYKMTRLHRDIFVLRAPDKSEPMINFVYKAQKLIDRAKELKDEISKLEADESQKASKEYLEKSCDELSFCCDRLKMYYQQILWGDSDLQRRFQESITNHMEIYDENFRNAYNYYMTTCNGAIKKEVRPSEDRLLLWIKKYAKKLEEILEDMESVREDIKYHGKSRNDELRQSVQERLNEIDFSQFDESAHPELVRQIKEASKTAKEALINLEEYRFDLKYGKYELESKFDSDFDFDDENNFLQRVIDEAEESEEEGIITIDHEENSTLYFDDEEGALECAREKAEEYEEKRRKNKADDHKYVLKHDRLKSQLDDISVKIEKIESKSLDPNRNFVFSFEELEKQEIQKANERGYATLDEYRNAIKLDREAKRKVKMVQEIKSIEIANGKSAKDAGVEAEKLYGEWMAGRMDFTKPQLSQSRDKTFFMNQAKLQLQDDPMYKGDTFLVNKISMLQSQAYDEAWRISALSNADKFKIQELYDEYSNDFLSIVLAYKMESGTY